MARTVEQVKTSFNAKIKADNPTSDVDKGPIYRIANATSEEISRSEQEADRLATLNTLRFGEAVTDEEIEAMTSSFGIGEGEGTKAKVNVSYRRYSRPDLGITYTVNEGDLMGNVDGTLNYRATNTVEMNGDFADSYYNSSIRGYEIIVPFEAVAVGEEYNLKVGRINNMVSNTNGFDEAINTNDASGGRDPQTNEEKAERIQQKFLGQDSGTPNGLESVISESYYEYITDISIVTSNKRPIFTRSVIGPGIDAYISGEDLEGVEQIYTAVGGETEITLEYAPVVDPTRITEVLVDNSPVSFEVNLDQSQSYGYSARANDKIVLANPLAANSVVTIAYTYNRLIKNIQNDFDARNSLFGTSMLARYPFQVNLYIDMAVAIASSFDEATVEDAVKSYLFDTIESGSFIEKIAPKDINDGIKASISGITSITTNIFRRLTNSYLTIEVVEFNASELPIIDQTLLNIRVRKI